MSWFFLFLLLFCAIAFFEIYIPKTHGISPVVFYDVKRGMGDEDVARDLAKQGIIKSSLFFRIYTVVSGNHAKIQAGRYSVSSSMSIAAIVKKFASGDIVKEKITIIEGWGSKDIAKYLESKKLYSQKEFLDAASQDWSQGFDFLKDKPAGLGLEGYLFPDTYHVAIGLTPQDLIKIILNNFDKKLAPELRRETASQKKSIFQIVTMASILEKEVKTLDDKKVVAGILWKRIKNGIPLQVDSTINYITDKNDPSASLKDTKINSRYNTYKYAGLPLGPISNPGMDSILAAIYPKESPYLYYLSADGTGKTIFSKTLEEHNIAKARYLNP